MKLRRRCSSVVLFNKYFCFSFLTLLIPLLLYLIVFVLFRVELGMECMGREFREVIIMKIKHKMWTHLKSRGNSKIFRYTNTVSNTQE